MDNDNTQSGPPEYGGANCCAVPIEGKSAMDMPIGILRLREDIACDMTQVSYECGTSLVLVPTVRVENGKATLVSVRIQHNDKLTLRSEAERNGGSVQ